MGVIIFVFVVWVIVAAITLIALKVGEASEGAREASEKVRSARRTSIENVITLHIATLRRKRRQLVLVDDYGSERDAGWRDEVAYFLGVAAKAAGVSELDPLDRQWASDRIHQLLSQPQIATEAEALNVESMDPLDFEQHCTDLLCQAGWTARRTGATGDQGVDIIAEKSGHKVALQCKRYGQPVGNFAVQEVEAGRIYHGASLAAVVSNATFTLSARRLAASTGTLLLHHDDLGHLEDTISKAGEPSRGAEQTIKYYYADAENRAKGPVPLAEIQRLWRVRTIHDQTWVIEEGATEWRSLHSLLEGGGT